MLRARDLMLPLAVVALIGCGKGVSTFDNDLAAQSAAQSTEEPDASVEPMDEPEPEPCGNGVIDPGEDCDGDFLHEETCETLGFGPGDLMCDSETCTYDTSMCQSQTTTGGGGMGGGGTGG